jgi:hypothetical protein
VSKEEGDGGDSEVTEARADVKASTDAAAAVEFAAEASLPVAMEADVGDDDDDDEGKLPIPGRGTVDWTAELEAVPFPPPRTGAVRESGRRFSEGGRLHAMRECCVAKIGGLLCTFFGLFLGLALQRGDGRSRRREVLRHHRSVAARVGGEWEDRRQRKNRRIATAAAGRLNGRVLARRCNTPGESLESLFPAQSAMKERKGGKPLECWAVAVETGTDDEEEDRADGAPVEEEAAAETEEGLGWMKGVGEDPGSG